MKIQWKYMLFGFNMELHTCTEYQGQIVRPLGIEDGMKSCLVFGYGLCGQSVVLRFMARSPPLS
jgi:hypothetical protein